MKILFLTHLFPLPPDSGSKIKSYYMLKTLSSKHEVCIIAFIRNDEEKKHFDELKEITDNYKAIELKRNFGSKIIDSISSLIKKRSFIISRDYRKEMQEAYDNAVEEFKPDVIHIDHLQMAQFINFNTQTIFILDNHNVESTIIKRVSETHDSLLTRLYAATEWPKLRKYELDICKKCDLVITVSETDKMSLVELGIEPFKIESISIGIDTETTLPVERVKSSMNILSLGTMHWPPNIDAMLYFAKEILPLVHKELPDATLTIAGANPPQSIQSLAEDPSITVTGYLQDINETVTKCGAFIVPLRSGSGVRVKILNAFAMGLPIVSTSIGMEGLDAENGKHLLIADTPREFAECVIKILTDPELAENLGKNGRAYVCENHSWTSTGNKLLDVYKNRFKQL